MSSQDPASGGTLLKQSVFLFFLSSRSLSRFSSQIAGVAIGWQVYDLTGRAFDLGMVGLVQFLPTALLLFVAGSAADRYERKRVVALCQLAEAATAVFLAWSTFAGFLNEAQIFAATFVLGIAGAFESPALAALLPQIAPQGSLQRATAISSGAAQVATITGPALGGLAYAVAPSLAYGIVVFAVSQWMWLSVLALAVLGAADTVSVVIRFSLVQLATPDEMRGRVGAVNFLFINASNQLGQFESGITAALFGTMPAAVLGGVATVAIALLWMRLFPTLREVERLE
jgi:transmembrane secretion effector